MHGIDLYFPPRFLQLVGIVPTDAAILQRLGEMYDADGDKSQAFQYHYDVSILFCLWCNFVRHLWVKSHESLCSHFGTIRLISLSSSGLELTISTHSFARKPSSTLRELRSFSESLNLGWRKDFHLLHMDFHGWDFSSSRPNQVKWKLMIASCHRRSGNYQHALETYKSIHKKFPDNVECEWNEWVQSEKSDVS